MTKYATGAIPPDDGRIDIRPYLAAIVIPTVNDVYRRWHEHVELDDLLQEAALWWYGTGQNYLPTYLAEDAKYVRLRRSLWRWCARYAEQEKAHRVGYVPQDQVTYRASEVSDLLPLALNPDGIPDGGGVHDSTGIKASKNLAEGGNVLASLIDVRRALAQLSAPDHRLLVQADMVQNDWTQLVPEYDVEADSLRRKHARIVERMTRFLNNDQSPEEHAA